MADDSMDGLLLELSSRHWVRAQLGHDGPLFTIKYSLRQLGLIPKLIPSIDVLVKRLDGQGNALMEFLAKLEAKARRPDEYQFILIDCDDCFIQRELRRLGWHCFVRYDPDIYVKLLI
jgi:hypothetical protein